MQPPGALQADPGKVQVVDRVPKRIKELKFGILSNQDIVNQAVCELSDRDLFDLANNRAPKRNGPLDGRMGVSNKTARCETCGEALQVCNGHFGHIKLVLPAFHVGYFKKVIAILQAICKDCSKILLPEPERRSFLRDLRKPNLDNLRKLQLAKKINERCRKTRECYSCGAINGMVRKAGNNALKITHDKFKAFNMSTARKKVPPAAKILFDQSFEEAKKTNTDIDKHLKKALDDLNPLRVLRLFRHITNSDCELLGFDPSEARPEMFLWLYVPAPPVCIRPSVSQDAASNEDDLTSKLGDIVGANLGLREALNKGAPVQTIIECWDYLQLQIAIYVNSDVPGLKVEYGKQPRGVCQRLKGKQGRFRGNLSGKRVDFSSRAVISPDPNLRIDEVAIPELVAKNLTYPETVSRYNKAKLQQRVKNGTKKWPGANYVFKEGTDFRLFLKYGSRDKIADDLQEGDTVERHLDDGDIVLFNRQPSLHKLSILSHFVKVRPHRTFRLNECVCTPYNADFDGDEMNLHVPQTEEARTEAMELMGVKFNISTPKNGEPIISAIQDFVTAAYLMSSRDIFYDRKTFTNICLYMLEEDTPFEMPPPTVLKPQMLWTGKQIFNVLMRPNKESPVRVNLDAACREYKVNKDLPHRDLDINDGWLCVRNSEMMCGVMDKSTIGAGKKDSIFYVMLRDYGPDAAAQGMNRLARLSARWLTNQGFSVGVSDVIPPAKLVQEKQELVKTAYAACNDVILKFRDGNLEREAGCDEEQTVENQVTKFLNKVRSEAADGCIAQLSRWNAPMIMATSGSKGSSANVAQMVATVGQQIIDNKRVVDGFQDRTLPHFPKHARSPLSKGFVVNSFYSGLTPSEFLFHAISGREGLVDTAVKTAETGYMSRRLMKSLEDLSVKYDDTVRNSSSSVVQFQYGDDKLDPVDMEGNAKPVNFDRTFTHAENITWNNDDKSLLPSEIMKVCEQMLEPLRAKLVRRHILGHQLDFNDSDAFATDPHESVRDFLQSIEDFIKVRADRLTIARNKKIPDLNSGERPAKSRKTRCKNYGQVYGQEYLDRTLKSSGSTLRTFIRSCLEKYKKAQVEPGHPVGAVGAQSIGEPGTQMTLKTFHFAGVAGMNLTQGVPRIKEIINASKQISTPIITCPLINDSDERIARVVKGRIEQTFLRDIVHHIDDVWSSNINYINIKVDQQTINALALELTTQDILKAIQRHKRFKAPDIRFNSSGHHIHIYIDQESHKKPTSSLSDGTSDSYIRLKNLKRLLPSIQVLGYPHCTRAVIQNSESKSSEAFSAASDTKASKKKHTLLIEGYGLSSILTTPGVSFPHCRTNSILETRIVLGIEAARSTIISELALVLSDLSIDPRHLQLLADVMTYKGDVLGITRFGLAKMRDSVLQLASFEKTADHLFEAGAMGKVDRVEGVSESVILGKRVGVGTGGLEVVRMLGIGRGETGRKGCVFEDAWRGVFEGGGKGKVGGRR